MDWLGLNMDERHTNGDICRSCFLTMAVSTLCLPSCNIGSMTSEATSTDPDGQQPAAYEGGDFRTRLNSELEQPSLFSTDELVIPPGLKLMRKAVSAIHAVPLKVEHEHTLNTRRLFDTLIHVAQMSMRSRPPSEVKRIIDERISPVFEVSAKELVDKAGIPGKNLARIYEALDKLFEMVMAWNVVGEDASLQWGMKAHFLSSLGVGQGASAGRIRFSMDPEILKIVLEPSNWAKLSLQALKQLPTPAAYALYQTSWRYFGTQHKVTAALPLETWIELLVGPSRYIKVDADGKKVINYADFKRRTLLDAIERVNSLDALTHTLELKEITSHKRVSKLQFRFVPKKQDSLDLPALWTEDVLQVLTNIGYSKAEIADLGQRYSQEIVTDSLLRLQGSEERRRASGKRIGSRKAYFSGILAIVEAGEAEDAVADDMLAAKAQAIEEHKRSAERQVRLKEDFSAHQATEFQSNLEQMPQDARERLIADFEASVDGQKTRLLWQQKGWSRNAPALAVLRGWIVKSQPDLLDLLLPGPQDRTFEDWMAWRLEDASRTEPARS